MNTPAYATSSSMKEEKVAADVYIVQPPQEWKIEPELWAFDTESGAQAWVALNKRKFEKDLTYRKFAVTHNYTTCPTCGAEKGGD